MRTIAPSDAITTAAFSVIERTRDVEAIVAGLRDYLGVDHFVYHSSKLGTSPSVDPYIRLTYPANWIKRYLQMGYVDIDPVLREGFLRTLPFDWSEVEVEGAAVMGFMVDALAHGVGPNGLSIPVRSKHGHRGLVSVSDSRPAAEWHEFRRANLDALIEIANRLHQHVIREVFGEDRPNLTAREIECLQLTAAGKHAGEIATILNISPHTARDHLKSARFKLDCATSTQAVSTAVKLGLLVP